MMITITSIKLKKWWYFFKLTSMAFKIVLQARKEKGFIKTKNTGWGLLHYTISAWETPEDLKRFAQSGAHLEAMKKGRIIATEVATYTYPDVEIPRWKEAKQLIKEKGKIFSFK